MSTIQVQKLEAMVAALTKEIGVAAASRDRMKYELKNSTTERDRLKAELHARDTALLVARVEMEKCEQECRAHTEAGRLFAQSALHQIDAVLPK